MLIEGDLARFLSEPVTIILGTADAGGVISDETAGHIFVSLV